MSRKPLTEAERLHAMTWAIDPKGALRAAGMDVDNMAKRAMQSYETDVPGAADQTKQIEELRERLYWAREETYNLQNNVIERVGTALWELFGIQKDVDAILRYLNPSKDGQP